MPTLLLTFLEESLLSADFSLIVVFFTFIILVYVLDALIFQPVVKVLEERERLTTGATTEAKKVSHDYDKQLANYEEKIRAARVESYKMLEEKRKAVLEERNKKLSEVKKEISEKIESSKNEIATASTQTKSKLEVESLQIAQSIAKNLLKRPLEGAIN